MSIDIGQHFIMGLAGTSLGNDERRSLVKRELGGVILFTRNIVEPRQLRELCREIASLRRETSQHVPLFISVDMEGGRVARLKEPFPRWPAVGSIAQSSGLEDFVADRVGNSVNSASEVIHGLGNDPQFKALLEESLTAAEKFAVEMGHELFHLGFNLNFAPSLDVLTNPLNKIIGDRAISQFAEIVALVAPAMIRGYEGKGILTCGKHFPGHGNTVLDSHFDLPVEEEATEASLLARELLPFRAVIASGVSMIMAAHLLLPALDAGEPVTTSKTILQTLLRDRLEYQGVITTDDMDMKALANRYPSDVRAVKAFRAGCDLLLYCNEPESFEIAFEGMKKFAVDKVYEGEKFSREQQESSVLRLLRLKKKMKLPN